jgi:formylglycine-generating enzyme required for sulfatase activity
MKFVPVPGTAVLFCVHEVRYSDYSAFWKEHSHLNTDWKNQTHDGFVIGESTGDHPVANVSWDDATAFSAWLSKREGLHYRLPTDREWSIAVGIGTEEKWYAETTPATVFKPQDVFPWGKAWPPPPGSGNYSDASRQMKAFRADAQYVEGGYDDGFPTTAPVMRFPANAFGLYDLGGNVWEWCEDWSSSKREERVLRGGSWYRGEPGLMLSSYRGRYAPSDRRLNGGFRVVIETAANLN